MTTLTRPGLVTPAQAGAVEQLLAERREGWSLPGQAYVDGDLFAAELRHVFGTGWLFVGAAAALPAGATQAWTVGSESVLVSRTADGDLHAFANVCAHRGSRLLDDDGLHTPRRLVCPYHSWAYDLDGSLAGAPHMGPAFCAADHRLAPLPLHDLAGLLFVSLDPDPGRHSGLREQMARMSLDVAPHLLPYALHRTQVAARETYRVAANWKTVTENNRECYHCKSNHPEFGLTNYEFGVAGDPRSTRQYERELASQTSSWVEQGLPTHTVNFPDGAPWRAARLPLKPGCVTESMTGSRVAPLLGDVGEASGSLRVILMPNLWLHVNCDYAMLTRVTPLDVSTTDVEVTYLVAAGAVAGVDFETADVTAVWGATSEQDWELSERNQRGQSSRAYRPGPLSPITETSLGAFHDWYVGCLRAGQDARPA